MPTSAARRLAFGLAALAVALVSPTADAQRSPAAPGARVRVTTSATWRPDGARAVTTTPERLVGTLVRANPDTLVVALPTGEVLVPTRGAQVEVSRGQGTQAGAGAGAGFVAGGLLGGLLGAATYTEPPPCEGTFCGMVDFGRGGEVAGGAILGALGGLVVGAVVGAGTRTERWEPARPVTVGVGAVRAPGAGRAPALTVRVALR